MLNLLKVGGGDTCNTHDTVDVFFKKTCHTQYCIVYFCKYLSVYNRNKEKVWKGTNQDVYSILVVCVSLSCNI